MTFDINKRLQENRPEKSFIIYVIKHAYNSFLKKPGE